MFIVFCCSKRNWTWGSVRLLQASVWDEVWLARVWSRDEQAVSVCKMRCQFLSLLRWRCHCVWMCWSCVCMSSEQKLHRWLRTVEQTNRCLCHRFAVVDVLNCWRWLYALSVSCMDSYLLNSERSHSAFLTRPLHSTSIHLFVAGFCLFPLTVSSSLFMFTMCHVPACI